MRHRRSWIWTLPLVLILTTLLLLTFAATSVRTTTRSREARACTDPEPLLDPHGTERPEWSNQAANMLSQVDSSWSCLPRYGESEEILTLYPPTDLHHVVSDDFNGDGWPDAVLARAFWQSDEIFEVDVLFNDGGGNLVLGTSEIFSGTVPSVMDARELVLADFNGDGRSDMFFADQGNDSPQGTGYQNTLVLSAPGGKMVDATENLPQQSDFTHSAAAADIDGDEDVDLYVGNLWGYTPQILLNVGGTAVFTVATGRLPFPVEDTDYGAHTTSEFVDVNNDTFPDLILGDAGDDLEGGPDSLVLLNDGTGHFSILANAIPSKPFAESDSALDIEADDINGDGYQDLFMVFTKWDYVGRYIQVLINNQDGTFRDETPTRLPQSDNNDPWILWVNLVDLDMDGHLDIAAAPMGDPQGPMFYLNSGDGTYSPLPNVFNIGTDNLFTFLDIDQDGYLDVLWSYGGCQHGACPEDHFLVRALGCPVFLPSVCRNDPLEPCLPVFDVDRLPQTYDDGWLRYLDLLDLNYDGHVDIVATAMVGPHVFYLNNGQGVFSEWDPGVDLYNFAFVDIDRDGWRDILLSGSADLRTGLPEWHAIIRHIGCLSP
jgi:hypothetical protein